MQTQYLYSNGPDTILVERTDKVVTHLAGGGEDVMYIDGPKSGTVIDGEDGGDTFVVCRLVDVDMSLLPGPKDIAGDVIIVDEAVFAELPAGRPLLMIGRFQPESDRLIVRAPSGVPVSFDPLYIHVGALRIMILGTGDERDVPFDLQSITIISGGSQLHPPKTLNFAREPPRVGKQHSTKVAQAAAISLAGTAVEHVRAGAGCADPALITSRAVPMALSAQAFGDRLARYADTDDTVVFTAKGRSSVLDAAGGNDTIYAFETASGTLLQGGSGADLIVECSLERSSVSLIAYMGDGDTMKDLDSDILVLRPEVFRNVPPGFVREISVFDFLPANDRLVLWLPAGTGVTFTDRGTGAADVRAGDVLVRLFRSDSIFEGKFDWKSVVLAPAEVIGKGAVDVAASPRADRPSRARAWSSGEAKTLSGRPAIFSEPTPDCAAIDAPEIDGRLAKPFETERYNWNNLTYTHGDDLVRVSQTRRTTKVRPGRGNDSIYLIDTSDDLTVEAGSGSDVIVLCSMLGATLYLSPGPGVVDRDPDTILIEPSIFEGLPKGIMREIRITGFMPVNDRLIVRAPANLDVKPRAGSGLSYNLEIGQVRIEVAASGFSLDLKFDPDALVVVPAFTD